MKTKTQEQIENIVAKLGYDEKIRFAAALFAVHCIVFGTVDPQREPVEQLTIDATVDELLADVEI